MTSPPRPIPDPSEEDWDFVRMVAIAVSAVVFTIGCTGAWIRKRLFGR